MAILKDLAVVLRLTDWSETSQIVTVLSREHGQLRLVAKGVRRGTRQRFAAGLDLLELGELGYLPARGDAQLATLTDWRQRESFVGLRRELVRLYGGLYAAELVAAMTLEDDPHPGLFDALVQTLHALAGEAAPAPQLTIFQRALLEAIGYAPDLSRCVDCRRPIAGRGGAVFFSAGAGGLLCRDCEGLHVEKWRVRPGVVGTTPAAGDARGWFELMDYHLTHLAGRRFKTAEPLASALRCSRSEPRP